jgi:hypothetical protein
MRPLRRRSKAMNFGKLPVRHDPRTLKMATYLGVPVSPDACDWTNGRKDWGAMGNLEIGDCTVAACGHAIQAWTNAKGQIVTVPDSAIIDAYCRDTQPGYLIGDPSTDTGAVMLDVLNDWRQQGIGGHKLGAYCAIDWNTEHVKASISLLGVCYIGLQLPMSADPVSDHWEGHGVTGDDTPGSRGGHAVIAVGYNTEGIFFISWGRIMFMTWGFYITYHDEAYALVSPDWSGLDDCSPSGLDTAQLMTDVARVAG